VDGLVDGNADQLVARVIRRHDDFASALPVGHQGFGAAEEAEQAGEIHVVFRVLVGLNGGVRAGTKELPIEGSGNMNRRNVVDVGFEAVLRKER